MPLPEDSDRHTDRLLGDTKVFAAAVGFVFLLFIVFIATVAVLFAIRLAG